MIDIEISDEDKKDVFERFLTYRRRIARMCIVQGMYLYEIKQKNKNITTKLTKKEIESEVNLVYQNVLYFYKNVFLLKREYGSTKKNKKIDEKYFFDTLMLTVKELKHIDDIISKYLNEKWTIDKLDTVIKSILRSAVCEILYEKKIEIAILTSEYTTIASHFFNGKEIGFVNGILDKIGKKERSNDTES